MDNFSTREAAKQLGIGASSLSRHIAAGRIPAPKSITSGGITVHIWTAVEIENVRKLLPKIANGRKTRYQNQRKNETTRKPKR